MNSYGESDLKEISSESVVQNERIYLHIYDYETKDFSSKTTFHGLVRIYNSNTWPSRIFWCVVVISCLSMFMTHSGILLWSYHLKPTVFQVSTVVPNGGLLFPDLTICNYNLVMKSKVSSKPYIYECSDVIKSCWWAGSAQDCCTDRNLVEEVVSDYGKCFTLTNRQKQWRQSLSGSDHGWEILVDVNNFDQIDTMNDEIFNSEFGMRLLVHDWHEFPILSSYGVSVPTGKSIYLGIELKNISLLSKSDWGSCESEWNPQIHGNETANLVYSAHHCEAICVQNWMLKTCGCVAISKRVSKNLPICTPYELYQCQIKGVDLRPSNCNCSVECSRLEYRVSISYSDLIRRTNSRNSLMDDKLSAKRIQDYAKIIVYFREMSYEQHEQHRQLKTADLLSSIAGSMGLFLGMSTVTLLEIFIYLFKSMWGTINTERQRQFVRAMIIEEEKQHEVVIVEKPSTPSLTESSEKYDSSLKTDSDSQGETLVALSNKSSSISEKRARLRKRALTIVISPEGPKNAFRQRKWNNLPLPLNKREKRAPQVMSINDSPTTSRRTSYDVPGQTPYISPQMSFINEPQPHSLLRQDSQAIVHEKRSDPSGYMLPRKDVHVHINRPLLRRSSTHYNDYLI